MNDGEKLTILFAQVLGKSLEEPKPSSVDLQYQDLLQTILDTGESAVNKRTGIETREIFPYTFKHDMAEGFPLLTTKRMPFKTLAKELIWFLSGDTNIKPLLEKPVKCSIWSSDGLRYNLEKVLEKGLMTKSEVDDARENAQKAKVELVAGNKDAHDGLMTSANELLKRYENAILDDEKFANECGDLGPVYGAQWRGKSQSQKVDQIGYIEEFLRKGEDNRRLIVNAWNPQDMKQMALPPCHYSFALNLSPESRKLSLNWKQRSVDTVLGLPFNIASYGLLLEMFAHTHNLNVGSLSGSLENTHIYMPHERAVREQLARTPKQLPKLVIKNKRSSVLDYKVDDFGLEGYDKSIQPLENPTPMYGGFF